MARRRYLSTKISLDKDVNKLAREHGDFAALLYTWLIPHALDDTTIPNSDDLEELKALVLPHRSDKSISDVEQAIKVMLDDALLMQHQNGLLAFPPDAFYKHQTYIAEHKRAGQTTSAKRRKTPQNADNHRKTPQKAASLSLSLSPSSSKNTSSSNTDDGVFDEFWERYPRKVGKPAARSRWRNMTVKDRKAALAGLDKWPFSKDKQFIPHPSTWLNQRRWEDEDIPFMPDADESDMFFGVRP